MKKTIAATFLTGFMIASMTTMPAMAYTNDAAPFEFTTNVNVDIKVGDNADLILAKLGEPNSSGKTGNNDEAWYYKYDGFTVYTSKPDKGKETVTEVDITGGNEKTQEGLGVGSTRADMITRYGNKASSKSSSKSTTYTYSKGSSFLDIILNCYNKITSIVYR